MGAWAVESAGHAVGGQMLAPLMRALDAMGARFVEPPASAGALLEGGAAQLADAAIGLHAAQRIPIGGLGLSDYAFCVSASLHDGLVRLARHRAAAGEAGDFVVVDDGPRVRIVVRGAPGRRPNRHAVELSVALVASRMRHAVAGALEIDEVRFAHAAPPNAGEHEAFFAAPVRFDAGEDAIVIARAHLARPLQTAAPELAALLDHRTADLVPPPRSEALLDRVRRAVGELLDERECGLSPLAQRLQMRRRTLQRELRRRATSHTAILDDVRRERALVLLAEERRTVGDIAERLGFSEAGAFFRAFRRWTGTTPKAYVAAGLRASEAPPRKSDVAPKGASFVA